MEATAPLTAAAAMALRPSRADFIKALLATIDENSGRNYGQLPNDFKVTDSTLASVESCVLDLRVDDLVDGKAEVCSLQEAAGRLTPQFSATATALDALSPEACPGDFGVARLTTNPSIASCLFRSG